MTGLEWFELIIKRTYSTWLYAVSYIPFGGLDYDGGFSTWGVANKKARRDQHFEANTGLSLLWCLFGAFTMMGTHPVDLFATKTTQELYL